ncbi:MAG: sugar phosphate isomerase/epimerase [Deltaproteobacteria bacterium]|nr:sugar phosphate isomerase/epimerase [Deltaproteobacteria bacterium]
MLYGAMNSPIRPVLKELKEINELGFDYIELTMDSPQAHYEMINQQKDEFLRTLKGFNMGIICHLPTFVSTADLTSSLREASLTEVIESLDAAVNLRPLKVVLHPSHIGGLGVLVMDQARKYAMRSLEAIVGKADNLGLVLCLENMFPRTHSLVNPEDFIGIFNNFPTLKMTLDTGHGHIDGKGGKKTLNFIERFADRICHIHASDNFGKEDNHLPIGTGTIDFPKIIRALKGIGYNDTVTFEVFSQDRDYLRISKEKFAAMFDAL